MAACSDIQHAGDPAGTKTNLRFTLADTRDKNRCLVLINESARLFTKYSHLNLLTENRTQVNKALLNLLLAVTAFTLGSPLIASEVDSAIAGVEPGFELVNHQGRPINARGAADGKTAYVAFADIAELAMISLEHQVLRYFPVANSGAGAFTIGLSNNVCH